MVAAVIAWVIGAAVVALIVGGLLAGRKRRSRHGDGLFTVPSEDERLVERTELQRGQMQALHNAQQVGPGGF